jgi:hypothetical protein
MKILSWYSNLLSKNPYKTKVITSFIIMGAGDVICQLLENKNKKSKNTINLKRTLKQASFAFLLTPYLHFQYNVIIPKYFAVGKYQILKIILYDQTVNAVVCISAFFLYMDFLNKEGVFNIKTDQSNDQFYEKLKVGLIGNYKIWPFASLANFTIIPIHYRVFFANIVGLFWNIYLSYLQNVLCVDKKI